MLKASLLTAGLLVALTIPSSAAKWDLDMAHSSVTFSVKHLVISNVNGKFGDFSGSIEFDGESVSSGQVEMTIRTASIDTDNADRDAHLGNEDFFDVAKFPEMSFKSKSVTAGEGNEFRLTGDLTIKGVTKEVIFDCEFHGVASFMGTTKAGFSAETTINRQDFGISWSRSLDTGGLVVSDKVEIALEIEANRKD